jgi:hypothetical protein
MDWREQSYPRWMQPADIARSQSLSTNVAHHAAHRALSRMGRALGGEAARDAARWDALADTTRAAIGRAFWQPALGHHAAYRYGRLALTASPRAEGLGDATAVVFGAVDPARAREVARRTPVMPAGVPTFWPFIPGERLYHNGTVWPFVTAFGAWAGAEAGNTAVVQRGLDAATRAAALFLTNKENMVAATGHYDGTALNNDRQLWSVAGTLASTYRLLFGVRLLEDRLAFRPMVPPSYAGERTLAGLRYRAAVLDVTVRGFGAGVRRATLDGRPLARAEVPAGLTGRHRVEVDLDGRWPAGTAREVAERYAPATPVPAARELPEGGTLTWAAVPRAARYRVYRNGRPVATTTARAFRVRAEDGVADYQVLARDAAGVESFLSEPVRVGPATATLTAKPEAATERAYGDTAVTGFTGAGFVTLRQAGPARVDVPVRVDRAGAYEVDVRYANGSGPVNTDSKAAVRTLLVDGREAGVLVMPQRGTGAWSEWGYSTGLRVRLAPGAHTLSLAYTPLDANMDRRVNTALVDHVRLARVAP